MARHQRRTRDTDGVAPPARLPAASCSCSRRSWLAATACFTAFFQRLTNFFKRKEQKVAEVAAQCAWRARGRKSRRRPSASPCRGGGGCSLRSARPRPDSSLNRRCSAAEPHEPDPDWTYENAKTMLKHRSRIRRCPVSRHMHAHMPPLHFVLLLSAKCA